VAAGVAGGAVARADVLAAGVSVVGASEQPTVTAIVNPTRLIMLTTRNIGIAFLVTLRGSS
jgi:hypothetical protein